MKVKCIHTIVLCIAVSMLISGCGKSDQELTLEKHKEKAVFYAFSMQTLMYVMETRARNKINEVKAFQETLEYYGVKPDFMAAIVDKGTQRNWDLDLKIVSQSIAIFATRNRGVPPIAVIAKEFGLTPDQWKGEVSDKVAQALKSHKNLTEMNNATKAILWLLCRSDAFTSADIAKVIDGFIYYQSENIEAFREDATQGAFLAGERAAAGTDKAMFALLANHLKEATELLIKKLNSEDSRTVSGAATVLSECGTRDSIPALTSAKSKWKSKSDGLVPVVIDQAIDSIVKRK